MYIYIYIYIHIYIYIYIYIYTHTNTNKRANTKAAEPGRTARRAASGPACARSRGCPCR